MNLQFCHDVFFITLFMDLIFTISIVSVRWNSVCDNSLKAYVLFIIICNTGLLFLTIIKLKLRESYGSVEILIIIVSFFWSFGIMNHDKYCDGHFEIMFIVPIMYLAVCSVSLIASLIDFYLYARQTNQ